MRARVHAMCVRARVRACVQCACVRVRAMCVRACACVRACMQCASTHAMRTVAEEIAELGEVDLGGDGVLHDDVVDEPRRVHHQRVEVVDRVHLRHRIPTRRTFVRWRQRRDGVARAAVRMLRRRRRRDRRRGRRRARGGRVHRGSVVEEPKASLARVAVAEALLRDLAREALAVGRHAPLLLWHLRRAVWAGAAHAQAGHKQEKARAHARRSLQLAGTPGRQRRHMRPNTRERERVYLGCAPRTSASSQRAA